jgi:hypothetical protein
VTVTRDGPGRDIRRTGGLAAGVLDLVLPLAACGTGEPAAGPEPTAISIASSTTGPSASPAPTTIPSAPASTASTDRGAPPSGQGLDAVGAVAAAQAAVADSTVVGLSQDDDDPEWEVTVRVGDDGRELRIGADGSVLRNEADALPSAQRGDLPKVTVTDAIETVEDQVTGGGDRGPAHPAEQPAGLGSVGRDGRGGGLAPVDRRVHRQGRPRGAGLSPRSVQSRCSSKKPAVRSIDRCQVLPSKVWPAPR